MDEREPLWASSNKSTLMEEEYEKSEESAAKLSDSSLD